MMAQRSGLVISLLIVCPVDSNVVGSDAVGSDVVGGKKSVVLRGRGRYCEELPSLRE